MGGADKILAKGRVLHDAGEIRLASEIRDKLVHVQPSDQAAVDLLAVVYEQLGYQCAPTPTAQHRLAPPVQRHRVADKNSALPSCQAFLPAASARKK